MQLRFINPFLCSERLSTRHHHFEMYMLHEVRADLHQGPGVINTHLLMKCLAL